MKETTKRVKCREWDIQHFHKGHHGTALVAAASGGHKEIVNLPINQGADVNAENGWNCT